MTNNQIQNSKKPLKKSLTGIVMAAGKGTRMLPLTQTTPKPMLMVGNDGNKKPILHHHLNKLAPLVDEIVIVIGHLGSQIVDHFGDSFISDFATDFITDFGPTKITYAMQANPVGGTLDALRTGIFERNGHEGFEACNYIVSNSDDLIGQEFFDQLLEASQQNSQNAYLCAKTIEDRELLKRYGIFEVNHNHEDKNRLLMLHEKPQEFVSTNVNIGLYYLPASILRYLRVNLDTSQADIGGNIGGKEQSKEEYITDLFNTFNQDNKVYVVPVDAPYFSLTSPSDIEIANQRYNQDPNWI